MITREDAALFSYLVYTPPDANDVAPPQGWIALPQYIIHHNEESGFGAMVFYRAATNEYVISYRGTDFTEGNDWLNNLQLDGGYHSHQLEQALDLVAQMQHDGISLSNVTFTGHSLGGGLASLAAVFFARPAMTFAEAPFEASARDDIGDWDQHEVEDYFAGYAAFLLGLGGPAPDANFQSYRDTWEASSTAGRDLFLQRELAVRDWYVRGDPVQFLETLLQPAIYTARTELDVGEQSAGTVARHDMRQIALLVNSEIFLHAYRAHPTLMEQLGDGELYGAVKEDEANTSIFIRLLRATYSTNPAERGLIDQFAADLLKIPTESGLSSNVVEGLIALAIEYYNYADGQTAGNFFTFTGNGLQFDMRRLPTWSVSDDLPAEDDGRWGRGQNALVYSLPLIYGSTENNRLRLGALDAEVWTLSLDDGRLVTVGNAASELQLGSLEQANYLFGAGGWDTLVGGGGNDIIDGGSGNDALIGYSGNDHISGGDGIDYIGAGHGNDIIVGGAGDDTLEGFAGDDTYVWSLGDGNDSIVDYLGNNRLIITGTRSAFHADGFFQIATNQWETLDHGFLLTQGTTWRLTIRESGEEIDLGSGDFNFSLHGDLGTSGTMLGDFAPTIVDHVYQLDSHGNFIPDGASAGFNDIIHGTNSRDAINGLGGNDILNGNNGDDTLLGWDGNDLLAGNRGADAVYGDAGDDFLFGGSSILGRNPIRDDEEPYEVPTPNYGVHTYGWNWSIYYANPEHDVVGYDVAGGQIPEDSGNYLDGGDGNDHIDGDNGDDAIVGGEGRDGIWAMGGADTISGGAGNDSIRGDGSRENVFLNYSPADRDAGDIITGDAGSDFIAGQGGADVIYGDGAAESATDGHDTIYGDHGVGDTPLEFHGDDYIVGGAGVDTIIGGGGSDTIFGGSGNDSLRGDDNGVTGDFEGDDLIFGGAGNDKLYGDGGNDVLIGGAGADELQGGEGADTYVTSYLGAAPVDGAIDTIFEDATSSNRLNRLVLGEGFAVGELRVMLSNADGGVLLYQSNATSEGVIAIQNAVYGVIGFVEFDGVQTWRQFINLLGESVYQSSHGDNGELYGGGVNDELVVTGNIVLVSGGHGDDSMFGDAGSTNYRFDVGDGHDRIMDPGAQPAGINRLVFGEGITLSNLGLAYEGGTRATLTFNNTTTDSIGLGFFEAGNVVNGARTIDEFEFADGSVATWADLVAQSRIVVSTGAESTTVQGTSANDSINLSPDDESIVSGAGTDTIYFGEFSGNDIIENDGPAGSDVVQFTDGLTQDDVQTFRNGNNLVVRVLTTGNRLFIRDFFVGSSVSELRFENGFVLNAGNITTTTWANNPTSNPDDIFGTASNNTLTGGGGNDRISGGAGNDTLSGNADNDVLRGESGDDTLDGGDGADTLDGGAGNDLLRPGAGQTIMVGGSTIVMGGTVYGGSGNDTLQISGGEGQATVWRDVEGQNVLSFGAAVQRSQVRIVCSNGDVWLRFNANERIEMSMDSFRALSEVRFNDGTILAGLQIGTLFDASSAGGSGSHIYLNGSLDDVTLHRRGQNLVVAYSGDVQDWVSQSHLDERNVLYAVVPGTDLGIAANSALVVYNWYDRPQGSYLSTIRDFWSDFSNGTTPIDLYAAAWNIGLDLVGTAGNDSLVGTEVNDTIAGLGGADILEGRGGNDTYTVGPASGSDTIVDSAGLDLIELLGISSTGVEFHDTVAGLEAVIGNPADGNRIVVQNWFADPSNRVERWFFSGDDNLLTAEQVESSIVGNRAPVLTTPIPDAVALANSPFSLSIPPGTFIDPNPGDTLTYSASQASGQPLPGWLSFDPISQSLSGIRPHTDNALYSIRFSATDGSGRVTSDTLTVFSRHNQQVGTASADTLVGGSLDDVLEGLGGADSLSGADGNDELSGGTGNDALDGGAGDDVLLGDAGEDRVVGGGGNDRLEGGDGADTYLFGAGFGNDTLIDTIGRTRIEFTAESGIGISNLVFTRDGDDMIIGHGGDSIRVPQWFLETASGQPIRPFIELITNVDGTRNVYHPVHLDYLAIGGDSYPTYEDTPRPLYLARGESFSYQIPENFFIDVYPGGLTYELYTGSAPPAWVSFDPLTRTISGTVPTDASQRTDISITARNAAGDGRTTSWRIHASDEVRHVDGTNGADVLTGGFNIANYIRGMDGNDTIDTAWAWSFADAGDGDDLIRVAENAFVYAGRGNDRIENREAGFSAGLEYRIYGEEGDDVIAIAGNAWAYGGDGNDTITGSQYASGDEGDDSLTGLNSSSPFAADSLYGGSGNDIINAQDGNDNLYGESGNDNLTGGVGNDRIFGDSGNDLIYGGSGNDWLYDSSGDDRYIGFSSSTGLDDIYDDRGYDRIEFNPGVRISQFVFARSSSDLNVTITGDSTFRISIDGWYSSTTEGKLEEFLFSDQGLQYRYSSQQIEALAANTNLAPEASVAIAAQVAPIGTPFSMQLAANTFSDAGSQYSLQYSATRSDGSALPTWLTFDTLTRTFSGTPSAGDAGIENIRVIATDGGGLSGSMNFVVGVGVMPIVGTSGADFIGGTAGPDLILARDGDDVLQGGSGDDSLYGEAGNDALDGGAGADLLAGGAGDDTYLIDGSDTIDELASGGNDEIRVSESYTLTGYVERLTLLGTSSINATGNALNNILNGNSAANVLDGASGLDLLQGGAGDDTYIVGDTGDRIVEQGAEGNDTVYASVDFTLDPNVENLVLTGMNEIDATGNSSDNVITGNDSYNDIDGGEGADLMTGGEGNDSYVVDNAGDVVVELDEPGWDTVLASISYTLGDHVDYLVLTGTDSINATGNALDNEILGNSGNNILDGGAGVDYLEGRAGNDTYVFDSTADTLFEASNEGIDTLQTTVQLGTLMSNVENMTLLGTANLNATGNSLANVLTGNSGNNTLSGGTNADQLIGGAGNDTYVVDNVGDTVIEIANEGADLVQASATHTLASNVENLTLTGSSAINGTGNSASNSLTGNSGNNTLMGGEGNDTLNPGSAGTDVLQGGLGDDIYVITRTSGVTVSEQAGEGIDTVQASVAHTLGNNVENLLITGSSAVNGTGNALNNALTGNSGNNTLAGNEGDDTLDPGSSGTDVLQGGLGNDTYIITRSSGVTITENASAGTDLVQASVTHTLASNVENLTLTGSSAINGTGNTANNVITGNSANNTLNAGTAGTDTLVGGAGNDTYVIDHAGVTVTELASEGTDLVQSTVAYTLSAEVENLTLTGSGAVNGTGNTGNNALTGNSGNNTLAGNDGNDTLDPGSAGTDVLQGGLGNDTYIITRSSGITITENTNAGTDTVQASVTHTLASNVENLTLTGSSAINGTGNTLANVLTGNSGNNTLAGGDGDDTLDPGSAGTDALQGGAGNDTYIITRSSGITITENASAGTDTVQASLTYTLGSNLENLTLTGSSAINGTGNSANNVVIGNAGNNSLDGGSGDDTLAGAAGTDSITGGLGADIYQYTSGGGADTINNVAADSLIDRLQFLDLSSDQIAFSRSGNNLVMSRIGVATDTVTVTSWFSATGNRLDFVNFTNREVTAAQIDSLVNGGGGSFPLSLAPPARMGAETSQSIVSTVLGRFLVGREFDSTESRSESSPTEAMAIDGEGSSFGKFAHYYADPYGPTVRALGGANLIGVNHTTLGEKSAAMDPRNTRWEPIKSFLNDDTDLGVNRMIDAMASFGVEAIAMDSSPNADSLARTPLDYLAANSESRTLGPYRTEFRAAIE